MSKSDTPIECTQAVKLPVYAVGSGDITLNTTTPEAVDLTPELIELQLQRIGEVACTNKTIGARLQHAGYTYAMRRDGVTLAGDAKPVADAISSGNGTQQKSNEHASSSAALEALLDESAPLKLAIASDPDKGTEEKMLAIFMIDNRVEGWDSERWGNLLGKSASRIRQTKTWRIWHPLPNDK